MKGPCHALRVVLLFLLVCAAPSALAVQASPFAFQAVQPDGTRIVLNVRGDEHFNWTEDPRGFTVVRDDAGRFVYARTAKDGSLGPTELVAGRDDPAAAGLERHLQPAPQFRQQRALTRGAGDTQRVPPTGNITNMVIMVRFANHTSRPLPSNADIDVLFNAVGGDPQLAPTGSVRDVYLENSYGQMTLNSTIFGWIDVPNTEQYYANGQSGDSTLWQALRYALDVVDQTVDFNNFDTDNDGFIDAIAFIHSGYGAEWGGTDQYGTFYTNRIWSHRWAIQPAWTSNEGVKVFDYHISPGVWGTSGSDIGRIGVIAHETGHFFGLPDLYDTDGSGSGIGSYGLMANSWGFDGSQLYPPHLSPWSKIALGWVTPTVISAPGNYNVAQAEFNADVLRIDAGYPSSEYLLIENRQPVGFDGSMPQGGLVVWHIDDLAGYNTEGYPGQSGWPGNGNHYRVAVLQADGNYDLEKDVNRGDSGDVYHGAGVTEIGPTTTPNTDAYQNGTIVDTGNMLSSISAAGASMSFTYGQPPAGPDVAAADAVHTYGSQSGTYVATQAQDDGYQSITETDSGGKPSNRHDRLDHVWRFDLSGTNNRFNVDAWRADGGDADTGFDFEWSASASGPWSALLTVNKTADDDTYQSATLGTPPATVYVRVTDNDRSHGERSHDTIYIDHMYFDEGAPSVDPPGPASNPDPDNGAIGVNVQSDLSWTAGVDTQSHNVHFGTSISPPFVANQAGTSFDPGTMSDNTTYYWRIDEVNVNGTTTGSLWSFTTGSGAGQCALLGQPCTVDGDCCSNKCKGKSGNKTCR